MPEVKMAYEQVPKISSIDMERQATGAAVLIQQQQAAPVILPQQPAKPVEQKAEEKKAESPKQSPVLSSEVRLKFIVDENTHAITILVVDRASKKVIRSIPPEEMGQFQQGDIFDYFA
jgi:uncharacterized FlaG/YvyC family protein